LDAAQLTFAAEEAGHLEDHDAARQVLLKLLNHPEAVVREGACYGLQRHIDNVVRERFAFLSINDPSPALKQVFAEALESDMSRICECGHERGDHDWDGECYQRDFCSGALGCLCPHYVPDLQPSVVPGQKDPA